MTTTTVRSGASTLSRSEVTGNTCGSCVALKPKSSSVTVDLIMIVATLQTYRAEITIGLKEGYNGPLHSYSEVEAICQAYCDEVGLGVEVLQGTCIYTKGREPCARVSLINYPRFPKTPAEVLGFAQELGMRLAKAFKQLRFSIVATDVTQLHEVSK